MKITKENKKAVNREDIRNILIRMRDLCNIRMRDLCNELEIALGEDSESKMSNEELDKVLNQGSAKFDYDALQDVLEELGDKDEFDLEVEVTKVIRGIGIPANLQGYEYLRYAIMLAVEDSEAVGSITKTIYPAIAGKYQTTPSRAERSIRHAIETAYDRGNISVLEDIFGTTISAMKGKATNSEFIALIADDIRLKRRRA